MTIRDLLAAESINLNGRSIARVFLQERRKAQQELEWV